MWWGLRVNNHKIPILSPLISTFFARYFYFQPSIILWPLVSGGKFLVISFSIPTCVMRSRVNNHKTPILSPLISTFFAEYFYLCDGGPGWIIIRPPFYPHLFQRFLWSIFISSHQLFYAHLYLGVKGKYIYDIPTYIMASRVNIQKNHILSLLVSTFFADFFIFNHQLVYTHL